MLMQLKSCMLKIMAMKKLKLNINLYNIKNGA